MYTTPGFLRANGELQMFQRDNGMKIWLEVSSSSIASTKSGRENILSIAKDITSTVRAKEQVTDSEGKVRSMVKNIPGAIFRILAEPLWSLVYVIDGITEITGYSSSELYRSKKPGLLRFIHPDDSEVMQAEVRYSVRKPRNSTPPSMGL